jgi:ankyrin repeat protein
VARLLLGRDDVDPNVGDECNITPITRAAQSGHIAIVILLLAHGADSDPKGAYGETPLAGAAQNGHVAVVKLLLDLHADQEFKDAYGKTALDHAVANGHEALIKLLGGCASPQTESMIEPSEDPPPYTKDDEVHYPLENDIGKGEKTHDEQPSVTGLALGQNLQVRPY